MPVVPNQQVFAKSALSVIWFTQPEYFTERRRPVADSSQTATEVQILNQVHWE